MRRLLFALLCLAALFTGLGPAHAADAPKDKASPLFGLVTGLGDPMGAYIVMQRNGMHLAHKKHGVRYRVAAPGVMARVRPAFEQLINEGCDVIIGGGFQSVAPVEALSAEHPEVFFIILDSPATTYRDNVASVTLKANEGSFLAGALAAMMSGSDFLGFVGGVDAPIINDFYVGYRAGALHVKPEARVEARYIAQFLEPDGNPFNAPETAEHLAKELYELGASHVFAVAGGGSNRGVFRAAVALDRMALGVDTDQDSLAPGFVLTSMMKRLDLVTLMMVEKHLDGTLENRNYSFGLEEGLVGLSPMTYTRPLVTQEMDFMLQRLARELRMGKIEVPRAMAH